MLPSHIATIIKIKGLSNNLCEYDKGNIKKMLDLNMPVIQFISRGYNYEDNKASGWNILKGIFFQHYVVIVGYNKNGWICYDPGMHSTGRELLYIDYSLFQKAAKWGGLGCIS